ncbi:MULTISPECIES: bifunctional fructose-bisphosphatase/inositol-phosphate phosphatase [Methanoculleus]|jgi:myo-inositol-1(or 4)-monophosphatase|uniref:fructose-bisphosphatase n=1 Tax=Methanoculleus thermophilus TaxID=2200 RepID=A0A1G8YMA4_9EURY|nr:MULTISPECIES: bifunctional fructose-bisphosphatase/inositol-phosphate phosphatase [Methanoculleus]NLN08037.1 bifunctional fructose-bisphosphatase/inositol-phosphate phosphatase [Methanoculleus thermophilus]SDK03584.1 D-fructose 1,6-bisphosphatase [Methanoculleus thermophilus]HQD26332.1 bifunctional fructose-bisphosphatase/inositol-phosphate phosphatase [Methanoculleus thermophilus]
MEFIRACDDLAGAVRDAVAGMVGTPEAGEYVKMGADGTPTKKIDQVAEDIVVDYFTHHPFCRRLISEELGCAEMGGESGTIFLDPIDGTYNAVVGIPFYAISIAYAEDGVVQAGYVQNLATGETFHAVRGEGAYLDGRVIHVSKVSLLEKSAMSVYGRKFDPTRVLGINQKIRRWRLLGASALELCYVGCGRIDGFIDVRGTLRVTDAAAGMLVCEEAGGRISDLDGNTLTFPDEVSVGRSLVATNSIVHNKVIEYLR